MVKKTRSGGKGIADTETNQIGIRFIKLVHDAWRVAVGSEQVFTEISHILIVLVRKKTHLHLQKGVVVLIYSVKEFTMFNRNNSPGLSRLSELVVHMTIRSSEGNDRLSFHTNKYTKTLAYPGLQTKPNVSGLKPCTTNLRLSCYKTVSLHNLTRFERGVS